MLLNLFKKNYKQEKCVQRIYHFFNTHRPSMGLHENRNFHDILYKFITKSNIKIYRHFPVVKIIPSNTFLK